MLAQLLRTLTDVPIRQVREVWVQMHVLHAEMCRRPRKVLGNGREPQAIILTSRYRSIAVQCVLSFPDRLPALP
jgi:hypothetical protein